ETHISVVFLAGDSAYKIKRALRTPFLDYSTLEKRRYFCWREVADNRELAPGVYRGVVPINAMGRIGGSGQPVEYAVWMRRLPDDGMLDERLRAGRVGEADIDRIAGRIAAFHAQAPRVTPASFIGKVDHHLKTVRTWLPDRWYDAIAARNAAFAASNRDLLDRRAAAGRCVDGHGDLHAGNVCLVGDDVICYDCIEFNPAFREADVAADLGFLVMDIQRHGAWRLADRLVERYVAASGDTELPSLLDYIARHRACVRGGVTCMQERDGMPYFRLAAQYGVTPFTTMLCGLPGTGKSYVADALTRAFDTEILRTDAVRKELWGMDPTDHWEGGYDEGPYSPSMTDKTYAEMRARERAFRAHGRRVVLDATFDRAAARALFPDALVAHVECSDEVVRERLAARAGDETAVSDADWAVYEKRRAGFEAPPAPDAHYDGAGNPDALVDAILELVVDR
ncbi:MAG: AAA family ATPase, partial [Planctomycetota bacterium]|nr:AAA family ATPase [Planctomycetota bacterium]